MQRLYFQSWIQRLSNPNSQGKYCNFISAKNVGFGCIVMQCHNMY